MSAARAPLEGLRVFDLTQGIAGPYCTLLMAAQGADVIKVEPPAGDWIRSGRIQIRGHAPAAIAVNAGKRSIALDLKQPAALAAARRIAAGCDVVIESFRPGVVERLGLDDASLRPARPELIYASITGFGRDSPLGTRPVIDHIAQAYSGWMSINADAQGRPQRSRNVVLADQITGLYAYQALSSALLRRFRFGEGARVDVTLTGAMAAFLAPRIVSHSLSDGQVGNAEFTPPTGDYATREGLLVLAVQKPADVDRLCRVLGRADLLADERFATPAARARHGDALRAEIQAGLHEATAAEWEARLAPQGVMACVARDIGGFIAAQRADGLDLIETLDLPGIGDCPLVSVPGAPRWAGRDRPTRVPRVGEDTQAILAEFGLPADLARAARPPTTEETA